MELKLKNFFYQKKYGVLQALMKLKKKFVQCSHKIKKKNKNLLTIIIPRHINRILK